MPARARRRASLARGLERTPLSCHRSRMPRIDPVELEESDDRELARIFIAATMVEARQAEAALTAHDVRYAVVAEPIGRTLFGSPRNAAVFYVAATDAETCVSILVKSGLEFGVVKE